MNAKRCLITVLIIVVLGATFGSVLWLGLASVPFCSRLMGGTADPPFTPFTMRLQDGHKALPLFSENVVYAGRHLTKHFASDHAVALQLAQLLS